MLKIFLCDNRQEHLDSLEKQIEDLMTLDYQIKKFTDARILAEELHSEDADILLTDIQMPGINGIQLAGESGNINRHIQIIFITAYEDTYVEDIFAVRPVYMLKKPVKKEKLEEALKLAIGNLNDENSYITITVQNKTLRIYADDIEYVESQQRKVFFSGSNHHEECYMKMDDIQKQLPSYFLRSHRSYIVNMKRIKRISNNEIELFSGKNINVPKDKFKKIKEHILSYWENEL